MLVLVTVLFGLVVGSFLNVVIHRVPRRESVVWPASHCPHCGAIRPRTTSPHLLCAAPRTVQELQGTHIGALPCCGGDDRAPLRGGGLRVRGEPGSAPLVLISALISLAVIDLEHRLLPNVIVGPAALVGLVLSILADPADWWTYPLSAVAVAGALFGLALIYPAGWAWATSRWAEC